MYEFHFTEIGNLFVVIIEKLFPNNGEKIVDNNVKLTMETIWPVTSFKLFIVHVYTQALV